MRAARTDANQALIVQAMRKAGASVQTLHRVGQGCPDLLVAYKQVNLLIEVKDGSKPPSHRKLTPDEARWIANWKAKVHIVTSEAEALALFD